MDDEIRDKAVTGAVLAGIVAVAFAAWHVALVLTAPGHTLGNVAGTLRALLKLQPLEPEGAIAPADPSAAVLVSVVAVVVVVTAGLLLINSRTTGRTRRPGLGTGASVARAAKAKHLPMGQIIGYDGKKPVVARVEDTGLMIATARMGKTSRRVIAWVLDAPAACVTTSTKADVLRATHKGRAKLGRVLVFDPEGMSLWPEKVTWDIVAGCEDPVEATERARALVAAKPLDGTTGADFFAQTAATVLRCYLHAAALEGKSMRDVLRWATDWKVAEPYTILDEHQMAAENWRADLEVLTRGAAQETTHSTQQALKVVLDPLASPEALASVMPSRNMVSLDSFLRSSDTLYLMSQSGQGSAAPLTTALVATVERHARRMSQHTVSGRLDPPLSLVLDEAANIAALPSLPSMMTDGGGRGMIVWVVVQSMSQLRERWGEHGADTIVEGAAVKLILGGSSDERFLEKISTLVGQHQVKRASFSYSSAERQTRSVSDEWVRILRPEEIRELPESQALLMYRNQKPTIITLPAWYEGKDRKAIEDSIAEAVRLEGLS